MRVKTIFAIFLVALNGSASNAITCTEALRKANAGMRSCSNIRRYCYEGWLEYRNRCYNFISQELNWFEAQEYCEAIGSRLPEVADEDVNSWILGQVVTKGRYSYWLGGNDIKNEGRWRWVVDNSACLYTNWFTHSSDVQPDGASRENCLSSDIDGRWFDSNCYLRMKFICMH